MGGTLGCSLGLLSLMIIAFGKQTSLCLRAICLVIINKIWGCSERNLILFQMTQITPLHVKYDKLDNIEKVIKDDKVKWVDMFNLEERRFRGRQYPSNI